MKPIKLFIDAYAISEDHISGIGHMTLELIKALERHPDNKRLFEIILVINRDRHKKLLRWNFKTVSFKTIPLPTRLFNILWKFDLLPPIDLFLGKGVYLFPNYKNWRMLRSKSLTFVCDVSYLVVPEYVSPKNQKFLEKNIKRWVRRTDRVLAISENAQREIVDNLMVDTSKTLLVPCGVDSKQFRKRSKEEVAQFKKSYGLPESYILYLGNIEPRKNINGLIEAYKKLPQKLHTQHALVLVGGGGWLNEPIMEAINQARGQGFNIIKPNQYIPEEELSLLHSGATILVHPAFYEGFGISPLQAMACETPTIVANNSSLPEVVGDAALLVNERDTNDISAKIRQLLEDKELQAELVRRGSKRVQKYTWENSADILVKEIAKQS